APKDQPSEQLSLFLSRQDLRQGLRPCRPKPLTKSPKNLRRPRALNPALKRVQPSRQLLPNTIRLTRPLKATQKCRRQSTPPSLWDSSPASRPEARHRPTATCLRQKSPRQITI